MVFLSLCAKEIIYYFLIVHVSDDVYFIYNIVLSDV